MTEAGYKVAGKMSDSGYVSGSDNDDNAGLKYGLVVGNVAAGDEIKPAEQGLRRRSRYKS